MYIQAREADRFRGRTFAKPIARVKSTGKGISMGSWLSNQAAIEWLWNANLVFHYTVCDVSLSVPAGDADIGCT